MIATNAFRLLVFVNPQSDILSEEIKTDWNGKITYHISQFVGKAFKIDSIAYFPLIPKMKNQSIDREWCLDQYQRGLFEEKSKLKSYQLISLLKKSCMDL